MQRNQAEFCVVTPKGIFIVDAKNFHVKMLYSPVVQVETRAVAAVLKKKKKNCRTYHTSSPSSSSSSSSTILKTTTSSSIRVDRHTLSRNHFSIICRNINWSSREKLCHTVVKGEGKGKKRGKKKE